jgi:hypothetical protein
MLDFFDWVYAEQTTHLAEQKTHYAEYLATFEDVSQAPVDGLAPAQSASGRQPQPAYPGGVH